MNANLPAEVRQHLAEFINVGADEFRMDADLGEVYGVDSTELTALAQELHQRYGLWVDRSQRADWATGDHIVRFLEESLATAAGRGEP